jgi:urease accessory protein
LRLLRAQTLGASMPQAMLKESEEALPLTLRQPNRPVGLLRHWRLPLRADERCQLRGRRICQDGQLVLLYLSRQAPLRPGEWLLPAPQLRQEVAVEVLAAEEAVLEIRCEDRLGLLQAAYHLGNRHVAMEIHADRLLLLDDNVLADLLVRRGLAVRRLRAPFCPQAGAYEGHAAAHSHSHSHSHGHVDHL